MEIGPKNFEFEIIPVLELILLILISENSDFPIVSKYFELESESHTDFGKNSYFQFDFILKNTSLPLYHTHDLDYN